MNYSSQDVFQYSFVIAYNVTIVCTHLCVVDQHARTWQTIARGQLICMEEVKSVEFIQTIGQIATLIYIQFTFKLESNIT